MAQMSEATTLVEQRKKAAPYLRYIITSFSHELTVTLRRRRIVLACAVTLSPVIIPVMLAFLSKALYAEDGGAIFTQMIVNLYLKAMAPLLALFFGSSLIGEDVESQTIPYLLTRPIPRSAWIIGKFLSYMLLASFILLTSILLNFFACSALGGLEMNGGNLRLLAQYAGVNVMALLGYGALCLLLGAMFRHPVIVGMVFFFGWQRLANLVPGLVDFWTIEKYVVALIPQAAEVAKGTTMIGTSGNEQVQFAKLEYVITGRDAAFMLVVITALLLLLTTYVVRRREYSAARAMGT